jgi:hypothetical protein
MPWDAREGDYPRKIYQYLERVVLRACPLNWILNKHGAKEPGKW